MTPDATSGPATILAAGELTTFFGHDLALGFSLPIADADPVRYTLRFRFETDPRVDDVAVHSEADDSGFTLRLTNFDRDDGRGSRDPVLLGELGDELLFLHFRVFRFGRSPDRTVHYTIYRATRAALGWRDGVDHG